MIVTLKLSDEELHILRPLADMEGANMETVLHTLIAQLIPSAASKGPGKPAERAEEEAEERAEEEAELRREQEEMQANIARWHAEAKIG
jgi:ribosomal protein L12E/L44/L45/RPP1/RPP2